MLIHNFNIAVSNSAKISDGIFTALKVTITIFRDECFSQKFSKSLQGIENLLNSVKEQMLYPPLDLRNNIFTGVKKIFLALGVK